MDFHNLSLQKKQKDCAKPCKAYRKYNPLVANYLLKKKKHPSPKGKLLFFS